jgi:multidrug resistance efflux pump
LILFLFAARRAANYSELLAGSVPVERKPFRLVSRSYGRIHPADTHVIHAVLDGTIEFTGVHGAAVAKEEVILKFEARPFEDRVANQENNLRRMEAQRNLAQQEEIRANSAAKNDADSRRLRLHLAEAQLNDLRGGPSAADLLTAEGAVSSAKRILAARQRELRALEDLARLGLIADEELRDRRTAVRLQEIDVEKNQTALARLKKTDPLGLAAQELAVRDAQAACRMIEERLRRLGESTRMAEEAYNRVRKQEERTLFHCRQALGETIVKAPAAGVLLLGRHPWGDQIRPGRRVWKGLKLAEVSALRKMKAVFVVTEGEIGDIVEGQPTRVSTPDPPRKTWTGKITQKSVRGRDEFELFTEATKHLVGDARRSVFEVEAELDGETADLFPGRRVEVEVVLTEIPNALIVPLACLRFPFAPGVTDDLTEAPSRQHGRKSGRRSAYVKVFSPPASHIVERKITVVTDDGTIAVVEGLRAGERVMLP